MRVDDQENVVVLEANANPCISPDSGFTAAALKAGYSFTTVIRRILSVM
jgi:D-alanine-D-alanine ligase